MCLLLHWRGGAENHSQQLCNRQKIDNTDKLIIHDLPVQVSTGSHILLAIQVAVAMVTPVETSYPVTQV